MTEIATSDKKYKPLPMYKKKGLSDDEALLVGIQVQNEKYAKLLKFVHKVSKKGCDILNNDGNCLGCYAADLLKEIGE